MAAKRARCLSNQRQLITATFIYTDDYEVSLSLRKLSEMSPEIKGSPEA